MAIEGGWRSSSMLFVAILSLAAGSTSHAAGQGTTTGVASFYAKGEAKEYKPGLIVWGGTLWESVSLIAERALCTTPGGSVLGKRQFKRARFSVPVVSA